MTNEGFCEFLYIIMLNWLKCSRFSLREFCEFLYIIILALLKCSRFSLHILKFANSLLQYISICRLRETNAVNNFYPKLSTHFQSISYRTIRDLEVNLHRTYFIITNFHIYTNLAFAYITWLCTSFSISASLTNPLTFRALNFVSACVPNDTRPVIFCGERFSNRVSSSKLIEFKFPMRLKHNIGYRSVWYLQKGIYW